MWSRETSAPSLSVVSLFLCLLSHLQNEAIREKKKSQALSGSNILWFFEMESKKWKESDERDVKLESLLHLHTVLEESP